MNYKDSGLSLSIKNCINLKQQAQLCNVLKIFISSILKSKNKSINLEYCINQPWLFNINQ